MKNALDVGKAAEHLVCADLLMSGYQAFLAAQGMPYDVVADVRGRLIRIQVKAACLPRSIVRDKRTVYTWSVRRRGKEGSSRLGSEHCDIIAAVALDCRNIAYLPIDVVGQTLQLMPPGGVLKTKFKSGSQWARDITSFPFEEAISGDLTIYRAARRALTHCLHGHAYTPENTYTDGKGNKVCRECIRLRSQLKTALK